MNVLIIYLQPKDGLKQVDKALKEIPCDILKLKYFPYPDVYRIAHRTITNHPEYDYIIWVQNDIIFNKEAYFKLCQGIKETGAAILGAAMNVDLSQKGLELSAYTTKQFFFDENDGFVGTEIPWNKKQEKGIIKVFHNGGVFICERELFVHHPLTGFRKSGYNADIIHGLELRKNNISYYLDTRINLKHLRYEGEMMVGRKSPEVEIIKY